jgi:hypothetical protein
VLGQKASFIQNERNLQRPWIEAHMCPAQKVRQTTCVYIKKERKEERKNKTQESS